MELVLDPFLENLFMQRALLAGLMTVVTTSLVGTWVVLRGLVFLGDAMAHGVIPGIALAFILDLNLALGAAVAALLMVVGIDLIGRRTRLSSDTSIGLLFVGMLALGVTIISLRGAYAGDLTAILFGDAIGVTGADVLGTALAMVVVIAVSAGLYRAFLVVAFSQDKAAALGFRPALVHFVMLTLVGLAVIASYRTVGTLLVFAFIVAPPAAASLVSRHVPVMMGVAVALGTVAMYLGLLVSYHAGTPASATVAVITVAEFFAVLAVKELRARRHTLAAS